MNRKFIDMENFPRKSQFEHFIKMAFPCVGFTVNIDITKFCREIKAKN